MKNIASILLILLLILLVACQNDSSQATVVPEPTVAVEDTPVEEAPLEAAEEPEAPATAQPRPDRHHRDQTGLATRLAAASL